MDYSILRTDLSGTPDLREVVRREHLVMVEEARNDVPSVLLTDNFEDGPFGRVRLNVIPKEELNAPQNIRPPLRSGLRIERIPTPQIQRMVDLSWAVVGTETFLAAATDRFTEQTSKRLAAELSAFLRLALASPDSSIAKLAKSVVVK